MFWQLLLLAAALGAAYYRWSRRRLYRLARELTSGLKEYPVLGHAHMFLGNSEAQMKTLQEVGRIANRQGGLSTFWLTNRLYVCTTDPAVFELVSKNCLEKDDYSSRIPRTLIGNGSIFARVKIWHPRRKIMVPFFSLKNLNRLVPVFQERSSLMTDLMRSEVAGGDFSVWKYMTTYTFDSVCETAMGVKVNSQVNPDHHIPRAIKNIIHLISQRMMQPWFHPDCIYERLPVYKEFCGYKEELDKFILEVIHKKRKNYSSNKITGVESNITDVNNNKWNSLLDVIIQNSGGHEEGYSDDELREEVLVMVIASNDTSATGLSFTTVMLSRYPEVQDKVYDELQEVLGDSDRAVTADDVPRLKYMDAVFKESLRLYPPVPIISREINTNMELPSGTTLIDGTAVMTNIWGTHRNPLYWGADAELFRPERFLEGPLRHPAQFIPFSYSVRNCVGYTYAMLAMKIALANLLRKYKFLPASNIAAEDLKKPLDVKFEIMMVDADNFTVQVEERKRII